MATNRAKAHAMCGLVCSGKTTVARRLAEELPALRVTRDEWMLRLYGLRRHDDPEYVAAIPRCTELMWEVAGQALSLGVRVILDWNHWSRERRADSRERAASAGVDLIVHYVDVPLELAIAQAKARLAAGDPYAHSIDERGVRHFATVLEPPDRSEGIEVARHSRSGHSLPDGSDAARRETASPRRKDP